MIVTGDGEFDASEYGTSSVASSSKSQFDETNVERQKYIGPDNSRSQESNASEDKPVGDKPDKVTFKETATNTSTNSSIFKIISKWKRPKIEIFGIVLFGFICVCVIGVIGLKSSRNRVKSIPR